MKNLRTVGWLGVAAGLFMLAHVDAASAGRAGQTSNGLDKNGQHQFFMDGCAPKKMQSGEKTVSPSCFMSPAREEQPLDYQGQGQPGAAQPKQQ
jgi:hypothetical protein